MPMGGGCSAVAAVLALESDRLGVSPYGWESDRDPNSPLFFPARESLGELLFVTQFLQWEKKTQ